MASSLSASCQTCWKLVCCPYLYIKDLQGTMQKAPPEAEILHQHFSIWLGKLYRWLCLASFIFFVLGIYCAFTKELYANKENFWNETAMMKEREAKGFTGRVTLREAIASIFEPNHPLHNLLWTPYNWYSYTVGSRIHNYCNKTRFLNEKTLPSLYRSFEFVSITQVFLRCAVLISLCVRIFLSIVMGHYIHGLLGRKFFVRFIAFFLPILDGAWMTFSVLILCFQTNESDNQITLPYMIWTFPLFAATFVAYGLLYITLTGFAFKKITTPLFQFACVLTFTWCYSQIHMDYWAFIKPFAKPCFIDVPFEKALFEYGAVICVLFFVLSQFHELSSFIGMITLLKMEHDSYFEPRPDYTPAYVYNNDSGSIHSQESTNSTTS